MIGMLDLKKHYAGIKDEVLDAVGRVLESAQYILGENVRELEGEVASYTGAGHAVGVASGTDALTLALTALGIGRGDEVITTPFTFFATVEAIIYTGATPVFVDIEPETFNIDTGGIEEKITDKTKAILPVHMFGHPADMKAIMDIAGRHGLKVVEDCAQAFGAGIDGRKVGSIGDAGCFSFYPSKNLGACGDGGMVTLKEEKVADDVRKLRNHGSPGGYVHERVGFNSRLDEIQAAILRVKMKRIDTYNRLRAEHAARYTSLLSEKVKCPVKREGYSHVYHQYTIMSTSRDDIRAGLSEKDIASMIYYPCPLHMQEALKYLGYAEGDLPVAEKVSREVLSLPMYPELEEAEIRLITETVKGV